MTGEQVYQGERMGIKAGKEERRGNIFQAETHTTL
jgi:hypothetical protein